MDIDSLSRRATILTMLGRHSEAVAAAAEASRLRPNDAALLLSLGRALRDSGDAARAAEHMRAAIALAPSRGQAHRSLSQMVDHHRYDAEISAMEHLWETGADEDRVHVGYGLAKALCDIGEHPRSVATYLGVNALQLQLTPGFDLEIDRRRCHSFMAMLRDLPKQGSGGADHVFAFGLPRSGKTSIARELVATGGGYVADEPLTMWRLVMEHPRNTATIAREYTRFITSLTEHRPIIDTLPAWELVGHISRALPDARLIYAQRGGVDHRIALIEKSFGRRHLYACAPASILEMEELHGEVMRFWRSQIEVEPMQPSHFHPPNHGQREAWLQAVPSFAE